MSDDTMATSRAIDAIKDMQLQDFADALVDRVSAIVGNHQLRVIEALDTLKAEQDEIGAKQDGFSHSLGAASAEWKIFNERQEAVSKGVTALRVEFRDGMQTIGERVSHIEGAVAALQAHDKKTDSRLGAAERNLGEHGRLHDRSTQERREIKDAIEALSQLVRDLIAQRDALIAQGADEAQRYRAVLDELVRERGAGDAE